MFRAHVLIFNFGARWGGWLTPIPCRFTPWKEPVPIVWECGIIGIITPIGVMIPEAV